MREFPIAAYPPPVGSLFFRAYQLGDKSFLAARCRCSTLATAFDDVVGVRLNQADDLLAGDRLATKNATLGLPDDPFDQWRNSACHSAAAIGSDARHDCVAAHTIGKPSLVTSAGLSLNLVDDTDDRLEAPS